MARIRLILLFLAALVVVIYIADFFAARNSPTSTVQVQPYYAIHHKDKKLEFDFDVPVESTACVQSLAPHFGDPPCWYLKRHTTRRIEE